MSESTLINLSDRAVIALYRAICAAINETKQEETK